MYGRRLQGNLRVLEGTELQTKVERHGQRVLQSGENIHQKARGTNPTCVNATGMDVKTGKYHL